MYSLWLSWKHLVHKPSQLVLNLVLLALSTGLIAGVLLFDQMITDRLDRNLAGIDLVIGAKGSPMQLILSGMYHLDTPTGNIPLSAAAPFMRPGHPLIAQAVPLSLGDSYQGYRIVGTDTSFLSLYGLTVGEGQAAMQPMDVLAGAPTPGAALPRTPEPATAPTSLRPPSTSGRTTWSRPATAAPPPLA